MRVAEARATQPVADGSGREGYERGDFDKDLTSVEQVWMTILQQRVSKNAVQEEECSRRKDEVVQVSPERAADAGTKERTQ